MKKKRTAQLRNAVTGEQKAAPQKRKMTKIIRGVHPSSHVQFVILEIILLLAVLGLVAVSATSAQNAGSPSDSTGVEWKNSKPYPSKGAEEKFQRVRMARDALPMPGPVKPPRADLAAIVPRSLTGVNVLINNNDGFTCSQGFTHSETTCLSFGNTIIVGFNDSGSFSFGSHFTGWSRSTDNGVTWTDGGTLPASSLGDAGDPILARDNTSSGRIYFATVGLS